MDEGAGMALVLVSIVLSMLLGALIATGPVKTGTMDTVHATLETRCVEGEQYSRDLLACVITRQGR